ncbi:MAG: flavodoxin family protein [Deltaproteobacteria bacterium]|nr:flavodoxin family protein [Deltaproteobacteria bacterium]
MAKKIVALILSPRELGNCEILVKEICRNVPFAHELQLIRLTDKEIKPCKACYACLVNGKCPLDDDFKAVAETMASADALLIATPTYFMGGNGMLKVFLDRCLQLYPASFSLRGKPVINLVTAGLKGEAGYSEMMLNSFSLILGLKLRASEVFYGALPGEIFLDNDEQFQRAAALGEVLLGEKERSFDEWACPMCGSDVIQLLGQDRIQCVVCRNYGNISQNGKKVELKVELNPENIFFTKEQFQRHGLWLQEMKARFMRLRRKLAALTGVYADQGSWL